MATLRVFTAIDLPAALSQKLDNSIQRQLIDPALRPVHRNSLHITLNFVGDVEDRETPELCRAFSRAIESEEDFQISLGGLGAFPNLERPRVLWLGVEQGEEELTVINQKLRDVIEDFGFVQEKRYKPHVTLARVQHRSVDSSIITSAKTRFEQLQWPTFSAESVIVYNSILEKEGPTYIRLATLPLTGNG